MTEKEYVDITALTRTRDMISIGGSLFLFDDDKADALRSKAMRALWELVEHLEQKREENIRR